MARRKTTFGSWRMVSLQVWYRQSRLATAGLTTSIILSAVRIDREASLARLNQTDNTLRYNKTASKAVPLSVAITATLST